TEKGEQYWVKSYYISHGWKDYRNYLVNGYMGNIYQNLRNPVVFGRIYNLEKANLGIPDRRKLTYLTNSQEGLGLDQVTVSGVWYRLPIEGGEMIRAEAPLLSYTTM